MMLPFLGNLAMGAVRGASKSMGVGGIKSSRRGRRRAHLSAKDLAIAQQIAGSIGKTAAANYILKATR